MYLSLQPVQNWTCLGDLELTPSCVSALLVPLPGDPGVRLTMLVKFFFILLSAFS